MVKEILFTKENASEVAQYCINKMKTEGKNQDQFHYDFVMSPQRGSIGVGFGGYKVAFYFDPEKGTLLNELKEIKNRKELDEADIGKIIDFNKLVINSLDTEFNEEAQKTVKSLMFGDRECPCQYIDTKVFDFYDLSELTPSEKSRLVIKKDIPKEVLEQGKDMSVSAEIFRICSETGKSFDKIVEEKKKEGDERYIYITEITAQKIMFECELGMNFKFF